VETTLSANLTLVLYNVLPDFESFNKNPYARAAMKSTLLGFFPAYERCLIRNCFKITFAKVAEYKLVSLTSHQQEKRALAVYGASVTMTLTFIAEYLHASTWQASFEVLKNKIDSAILDGTFQSSLKAQTNSANADTSLQAASLPFAPTFGQVHLVNVKTEPPTSHPTGSPSHRPTFRPRNTTQERSFTYAIAFGVGLMLTIIALYFAYSFHHRRLKRVADEALAKLKDIGGKVFPAPEEEDTDDEDDGPVSSVQMISMLERIRREREAQSLQQQQQQRILASPPQVMMSQAGRRLNPQMQPQTTATTGARLTVRSPSPTAMMGDDKPKEDKIPSYSKSLLEFFGVGRPRNGNADSSAPPKLTSVVPAQASQFEVEVKVSKHRRRRSSAVVHYDTDDDEDDEADDDDDVRVRRRRRGGGHHVKSPAPRRQARQDYSDESSDEDEVEKDNHIAPRRFAPTTFVAPPRLPVPVAIPVQLRSAAARRIDPIFPTQTASTLPAASLTLASSSPTLQSRAARSVMAASDLGNGHHRRINP